MPVSFKSDGQALLFRPNLGPVCSRRAHYAIHLGVSAQVLPIGWSLLQIQED